MRIFLILFISFINTFCFGQSIDFDFQKTLQVTDIQQTSLQFAWQTNAPSVHKIRYGTSLEMTQELAIFGQTINGAIQLNNLTPATFYYVQIEAQKDGVSIFSEPKLYTTASTSTGEIQVLFNNSVDESYSNGSLADADSYEECLDILYDLIDNAELTIDVAMYNTGWYDLVNALEAAHNSGIQVRYIYDDDTSNQALNNPDFPSLERNPGDGIMHNKFIIIDAANADLAQIVTGSMNWTYNQITSDPQNTVIIQDQALALAYQTEFEEMWGSTSAQPDANSAKFGSQKSNNTPHEFNVNGRMIESYFSPSDQTSEAIRQAVVSADTDLECGLMLLTYDILTAPIKDERFQGTDVRGIFNDNNDNYTFLKSQGVNVKHHWQQENFHHKYAIIDATDAASDPTVVTGSHNWTWSAENINDENTLIIHDETIANLFLQEFEARWNELTVATTEILPMDWATLLQNPVQDEVRIQLNNEAEKEINAIIYDLSGKVVLHQNMKANSQLNINVNNLLSGSYIISLRQENRVWSMPFCTP